MGKREIGASKRRFATAALVAVAAASLVALTFAAPAHATFPGANGKFAFGKDSNNNVDVFAMNPDGSNLTRLTTDPGSDGWPTWSADGTKIAFASNRDGNYEIYVMNSDGSGQTNITQNSATDVSPSLSPDGTKIAFESYRVPNCCVPGATNADIYTMNADGSNQTRITFDDESDEYDPVFSPDGQKIASAQLGWYYDFTVDEWVRNNSPSWGVMNLDGSSSSGGTYGEDPSWSPDGTKIAYTDTDSFGSFSFVGVADVACCSPPTVFNTDAFDINPIWSPDGQKIAFASDGGSSGGVGTYTINPDGTGRTQLNGFFYGNQLETYASFDWQALRPNGYARPKSATPTRIRLVPAYKPCMSANGSHGAPLALASCNPPVQESGYATIGHGDGHPTIANSSGNVALKVLGESPINPDNGDQADVQLTASITDVRNLDFSDYTGELRVSTLLRITDRNNAGLASPPIHPATSTDTPFGFAVSCLATASESVGSTCSASTTADAVLPGVVLEGKRAIWQLGQVEVYDGGADGDADTTADNTLFAVQGLFAP